MNYTNLMLPLEPDMFRFMEVGDHEYQHVNMIT